MASSVERNNELFPAVVAGDAKVRVALVEENLALVMVKVDAFLAQAPGFAYLRDDLISAGRLGLVKAVNKLPTGRIRMHALNKWIGRCVTREFVEMLATENVIRVPGRTSRRRCEHGGDYIPNPVVLHNIPETLETDGTQGTVDLEDVFAACCRSDEDRVCLRLRREGYTLREIAPRLKLPLRTTYRLFRQLQARIREHLQ